MRYMLKQKVFSFGDKFAIKDENQRELYYVEGRVFSFGDKLSLQDIAGNEIYFISQKVMSWSPTYEIYRGEELCATLKKELFTFFKCRFDIESSYGNLQVEGDFLDRDYSFEKNGRTIARVSKEWFTWGDTYGVDIDNSEDQAFILACVIAIDMICHNEKKK